MPIPPPPITSRAWASPDDTRLAQELVSAQIERDWPALRLHPGDLDWWAVLAAGREPALHDRVRLWFRGPDTLVGCGWFGLPGELDALTASDDPAELDPLLEAIVAWADERQATLTAFERQATLTAFERQATLTAFEPAPLTVWAASSSAVAAALGRLGLEPSTKPGYLHFTGPLDVADGWAMPAVPSGLAIRALTDADVPARVSCGRAAFSSSTMTEERYLGTRTAHLYRRDLDLICLDAAGRVVAFALGWLDPTSRVVELEPVGVHPDWHRRGLGGEICRATLRAARDRGATRALIAAERANPAAMGLYASLGLTIGAEIVAHGRPTAG